MKQICLVGPIDKRPLAYPLIKAAELVGKLLVVTDDSNFRRFADNYEKVFNRGNSDFLVVNDIDESTIEDNNLSISSYDFVIYITTNTIIPSAEKIVYCHGLGRTFLSETDFDKLFGLEYSEVVITQGRIKDKKQILIPVDKPTMGYVWDCEETKEFVPVRNANLAKIVVYLFEDTLGVPKDELSKLLVRKEG